MVRQPGDHLADPSSLLLRMGSRLRARRRELGRTLAEVAGPADVSVSYLSAVEKGTNQPSLQVLARIVHALDLRIADVLRAEGQNHVRVATVDDATPGGQVISHAGLQLEIVALTARPGDAGPCPVTLDERDLAVVVHRGAIVVSVDGEDHDAPHRGRAGRPSARRRRLARARRRAGDDDLGVGTGLDRRDLTAQARAATRPHQSRTSVTSPAVTSATEGSQTRSSAACRPSPVAP